MSRHTEQQIAMAHAVDDALRQLNSLLRSRRDALDLLELALLALRAGDARVAAEFVDRAHGALVRGGEGGEE